MRREAGSRPRAQLVVLSPGIAQVLPHHSVRLRHEGTVSSETDITREPPSESAAEDEIETSGWAMKLEWRWDAVVPTNASLLLNGHQQMFHQHHICYLGVK